MVKFDMRLFQRKSGAWYVEFRRGVKRSLHTRDEKEARKRLKMLEKEALHGKLTILSTEPTITLNDFLDEYDRWMEKNLAPTTWDRAHRIWPGLREAVGGQKYLANIRHRDLDNYVEYCRRLGHSPVTINIGIRHIKSALSQAVRWGYLKENPFRGYRQIPFQKKRLALLSPADIQKVFEAIGGNRKYRLIFALYVYTGARREEIHRLEWKHIKDGFVHFDRTKNREHRAVPIVPKLAEVLEDYPRGVGRLFDVDLDHMGRQVKYFLRKAGVGHVRPHDLRHTFASWLLMSCVDPVTVSRLLGHRTPNVTLAIYAHVDTGHLERAMEKLPY